MSQQSVTTVASSQPAGRVRKVHDLAQLFPEIPGLANSAGRMFSGFADSGPGVPELMPGFIQEAGFMEEFLAFLASDLFMLTLFGPTGCGKTERLLQFYAKVNIPVFHVSATADTRTYDLIGDKELVGGETKFVAKPLYRAMKNGYPIIIDEVYRLSSKITSKFHTIRDHGELYVEETGEVLKAKPGFKLLMTANQAGMGDVTGQYPGDEIQDIAFLNGSPAIECGYPAPSIEEVIVQRKLESMSPSFATEPELKQFAPAMVKVANRVRSVFVGNSDNTDTMGRIEVPFSTRHLVWWADFFVKFKGTTGGVHPLYKALDFVLARRACAESRLAIDGFIEAEFGIRRTDQA